jgi:hypothetical protein
MKKLELHATLWPSFPHFGRFAKDSRLSGIRLNSAMMSSLELEKELEIIASSETLVPLFFDIKARQLRITEVHLNENFLDISINHPISVDTPTVVLFKAGEDQCLLERVTEGGRRLIFRGGPNWMIREGESFHIRHPSLRVHGPLFSDTELLKIERVSQFGFKNFYLSYVQSQRDVDQFIELVGHDSLVMLKIEDKKGLDFVRNEFKKKSNLVLVAARGDLYVEVDRPHEILPALRLIIKKDPEACVGSRILLSVCHEPVPSCADFSELAWLYDIGYRKMLLCDELCLKGDLLSVAVNAFESFRQSYGSRSPTSSFSFFRRLFNQAALL